MSRKYGWIRVSPERISNVIDEITYGSEPGLKFYALVITSSLIASLGLIANSTAVIIGAMLVAPLMTPIFGMALGLVRGNANLLERATRAEGIGVIVAIVISVFFRIATSLNRG